MSVPDPNRRQHGHNVRVFNCHVAMTHGLRGSQRMAVLTFSRGREVLEPYCLSTMQVHVLVRELIQVLHALDPSVERDSDVAIADPPLPSPAIPTPPRVRARTGKGPQPSRNPSAPTSPIQPKESWQLHSMLKNVRSHDDFLKFIGADPVTEEPVEPADPKASPPTPTGSVRADDGRERPRRRLNRSRQRGRRKEK